MLRPILLASALLLASVSSLAAAHDGHGHGPTKCDLVVVGAGIGGIYSAYRLAVETKTFAANKVCIFEALSRPGGRILTVRGTIPSFDDYTVDLGAYR